MWVRILHPELSEQREAHVVQESLVLRLYSSEALVDERKAFTLVKRVRFPTEELVQQPTARKIGP